MKSKIILRTRVQRSPSARKRREIALNKGQRGDHGSSKESDDYPMQVIKITVDPITETYMKEITQSCPGRVGSKHPIMDIASGICTPQE